MTYLYSLGDAGSDIGFGTSLMVLGDEDAVVESLSGNDPRPDLPRDKLTFFMGENLTGNMKFSGDSHNAQYGVGGIPSGANSVYIPPGWTAKLYEESDRKKAALTGDKGKRWQFDGPAVFNRPQKPGYGRKYNWAWVRASDHRTDEQKLRDQQVATLQREQATTSAESAIAAQYAADAERTRLLLEQAQQSVAQREQLREQLATQQASDAAEQAKQAQLAVQQAQAEAQAQWVEQQRQAADMIRSAQGGGGGMPGWVLPVAGVVGALAIVGAILASRRR